MTRAMLALLGLTSIGCPTPPRDPRPQPPVIELFEASQLVVRAPGTTTVLRWRVAGADVVRLDGLEAAPVEVPATGEREIPVDGPVTVALVAQAQAGEVRAVLVLSREDDTPVRVLRFDVVPIKVRAGDAVTISWDAPGSRGVLVRAVDEQLLVGDGAPRGSITYVPRRDLVFELRADGLGGPVTATSSVAVVVSQPLIEELRVQPVATTEGRTVTVRWLVRGLVDGCALERQGPDGNVLRDERPSGFGELSWEPAAGRHRISLVCAGPGGRAESAQTVVIEPAVRAQVSLLGVQPAVTGPGGSVAVLFRATGAEWVAIRTAAGVEARVSVAEGRAMLVAEPQTYAVRIEPEALLGTTATATVVVDPQLPSVLAAEATVNAGRVVVEWRVAGASRVRVRAEGTQALLLDEDPSVEGGIVPAVFDERWLILEAVNDLGVTTRNLRIPGR